MKLKKYLWNYLVNNGEKQEGEKFCVDCRSCQYYDFSYKSQLEGKVAWVRDQYQRHLDFVDEIIGIPSPKPKYYRNKMDFVATQGIIGQRKGGFNRVYDVHESCIFDQDVDEYLSILRKFKEYPDYDLVTHEGVIRYYVVRKHNVGNINQYSLSVVLNNPPKEFSNKFAKFLKSNQLWEWFTNIYLVEQSTLTDLSYGHVYERIKGKDLQQTVSFNNNDITYTFGPQSFFQANVSMFEVILEYMQSKIKNDKFSRIIDAYGGIGSIGIALSKHTKELVNVESNSENTEYFEINVENNCAQDINITSITQTVDEFLSTATFSSSDLLLLDPPRAGMQNKAAETFIGKKELPRKVIYMSCNPATQVQDLKIILKKYKIDEVRVFDMFPYTSHVEAVAILSLKDE